MSRISATACLAGVTLALGLLMAAPPAEATPGVTGIEVDGTDLRVEMSDGTTREGPDLIGAVLRITDANGLMVDVRIDGAERDTAENGGNWLFALKIRDGTTGEWIEFCDIGPDGTRLAFPVAGRGHPDGSFELTDETFTISCTAGAIAKCIRMGYVPWESTAEGMPLIDHFRACMRMVRADYCGTGEPHTRDGTLVNIYDRLGIQKSERSDDMLFEAGWGPGGAVCVAKTRLGDVWTLDQLRTQCGARLAGRIGETCTRAGAMSMPGALIFNDSRKSRRTGL